MRDAAAQMGPQTIYLADYQEPSHWIDTVELTFDLHPTATRVRSKIAFRPNPTGADGFFLHGEDLSLIWAKIDGVEITPTLTAEGLTADVPDGPFVWEAEVEINPQSNTRLEGLYMSGGMYCTQCEAEGFRRITYYPDRPDVMAPFSVHITGNKQVLLSNGNPTAQAKGRASWHDPWPKPAYLFALVAGDLVNHPGQFTTQSGRHVELNIWVRPGDEDKCAFGMQALKDSMAWDERAYGREYDLDLFNIVAVDDFNMGAMENKGLNIFNSSCVLASPDTATDANFQRIEAIIAHEYFHNWTGNRITCRDWFQLCLKEGLTVFRDQQFSADMRSAPVQRIDDVLSLRARQFPEDNGPLAHPVRPESFVEINNFYTATIYEKGAEVIGMLRRLVGAEMYDAAVTLYFDRHDGQACTIEDWLACFSETTGRDLSQFKLWYEQAGTPRLHVSDSWVDGTYTLTLRQEIPPTPGQDLKMPMVIPVAFGLLSPGGAELLPTQLVELDTAEITLSFDLAERPVPSLLRGFSAPVILIRDTTEAERLTLLAHDTDPFNRWDAGRALAKEILCQMVTQGTAPSQAYIDALVATVRDDSLDPAFRALVLSLPSQDDLAQTLFDAGITPDPLAIYDACETLTHAVAEALHSSMPRLMADLDITESYQPNADQSGKRALSAKLLGLLTRLDGGAAAQTAFDTATNMTAQLSALGALVSQGHGDAALLAFYDQWHHERLVIDKWFGLQVSAAAPAKAVDVARTLMTHPDFTMKNPNRFRAVFGALAGHHAGLHADGRAYALMADKLIELDGINPQLTARMCTAFQSWRRYDADRQAQMQEALTRIQSRDGLSSDTGEMVGRLLG